MKLEETRHVCKHDNMGDSLVSSFREVEHVHVYFCRKKNLVVVVQVLSLEDGKIE